MEVEEAEFFALLISDQARRIEAGLAMRIIRFVWSLGLVVRVKDESGRLVRPGFADGFIGSETSQGLQAPGEVVGGDEV